MAPTALDVRLGVCVLVCLVATNALSLAGMGLIQPMPACITCLLCCMDDLVASRDSCLLRVKVTVAGGVCGVAVVALDTLLGSNPWVLALLCGVGVAVTLVACRAVGVPAFNARIGTLTFLLVAAMLTGTARVWYALWRLVSTVFGSVVVLLVT